MMPFHDVAGLYATYLDTNLYRKASMTEAPPLSTWGNIITQASRMLAPSPRDDDDTYHRSAWRMGPSV